MHAYIQVAAASPSGKEAGKHRPGRAAMEGFPCWTCKYLDHSLCVCFFYEAPVVSVLKIANGFGDVSVDVAVRNLSELWA